MDILIIAWVFILWTILWSFWSVIMTRLEWDINRTSIKWILFWFSRCPSCHKRLHAHNLIPLFSYLFQRWKCEHCKAPISKIYPILEILSWVIAVISYIFVYNTLSYIIPDVYKLTIFIFWLITNRSLLLMIIYDIQKYELHMAIRVINIIWILLWQFTWAYWNYQWALLNAILFFIVFEWIYYFGKRYVSKFYKKNNELNQDFEWEWFGKWDIFIWISLWIMSPFIAINNLQTLNIITSIKILILLLIISSLLGIIYFGITYIIKTFSQNISSNSSNLKIIPFIPSLIISFWILLFYADRIIALVFN